MADNARKAFRIDEDSYRDYARKMDAFVYGPTTTYFDQLLSAGTELPANRTKMPASGRAMTGRTSCGYGGIDVY